MFSIMFFFCFLQFIAYRLNYLEAIQKLLNIFLSIFIETNISPLFPSSQQTSFLFFFLSVDIWSSPKWHLLQIMVNKADTIPVFIKLPVKGRSKFKSARRRDI